MVEWKLLVRPRTGTSRQVSELQGTICHASKGTGLDTGTLRNSRCKSREAVREAAVAEGDTMGEEKGGADASEGALVTQETPGIAVYTRKVIRKKGNPVLGSLQGDAPAGIGEGGGHSVNALVNEVQPKNCRTEIEELQTGNAMGRRRRTGGVDKALAVAKIESLPVAEESLPVGKQGGRKSGRITKGRKKTQTESLSNKKVAASATAAANNEEMLTLRRCGGVNSLAVSSIKESEVTEISLSCATETKTKPKSSALSPLNHILCKGEGLIQLAESSQIVTAKQETGGTGGDSPQSQMVVSTSGLAGGLAKDTGSMAVGEDVSSGVTEGEANTTREKVDESAGATPRAGWVRCDDCGKWRCISVELADEIDARNAHWSCSENPNREYADCSIPQEKTNAEINRELDISENSVCGEADDMDATGDSKPMEQGTQEYRPAVWTLIRHNMFQHRSRKQQDADEAMVCQCKPPADGEVACGEDCLNRMLNVECLAQQCPCGSACSNQQFQKRIYTKVDLFRCGKKGFGLQVKENVPRGSFIIEYVGEVLDMPSFEVRQKEYAVNGQKHFYFMTLNANEIIDACVKGNLGRFINHSCNPNCRTEKWMVDGEVCIGLFAVRDLTEGEEITFDYNFVRVGGAVAKRCECGAANCRGFIGGDPDTPRMIVENDSDDEEDPEPIMLKAESDEETYCVVDNLRVSSAKKLDMYDDFDGKDTSASKIGGAKRKYLSTGAKEERDFASVKRVKRVKTSSLRKKTGSALPQPRGLYINVNGGIRVDGSRPAVRNNYYSDVEEKLGEISDRHGGLKNRKDAAKHYLKLLVLAAASGESVNGAAFCSVRDLSMLLEALLKTSKLGVLKDIMNKNGLRMFHNLIKQFRKTWLKLPILRKLLKVLEHLATHKVLTVEHIYADPPRSGMERTEPFSRTSFSAIDRFRCFSDSLFELTRHEDLEVQNMARKFRRDHVPPRPPRIDLCISNGHRQSPSSTHSQQCDQMCKGPHTSSPSRISPTVQSTRVPLQASSPVKACGSAAKPPLVKTLSGTSVEVKPPLQEGITLDQQSTSPTVDTDLLTMPPITKRKRPSRWDTPKTDLAVLGHANSSPAIAVPSSVKDALGGQHGLASSPPSHEQGTLLQLSAKSPLHSGPLPRLPPQPEVPSGHQKGSEDLDKTRLPPPGSVAFSHTSTQASKALVPGQTIKPAVVGPQTGTPRPPPGPPPPGQPSVLAKHAPPGQPGLVYNAGQQQMQVLLPRQPAGSAQMVVGLPGQRPMVPPGPVHLGMHVVPRASGMAMAAPPLFGGAQIPSPNLFQRPALPVTAPGGVPLGGHPRQGAPVRMPLSGPPPMPFRFPPGPPGQVVPQSAPLRAPGPFLHWQMMQPGGAPHFVRPSRFPMDNQRLPPPPHLPTWVTKPSQLIGSGGPVSVPTSDVEKGGMRSGDSASQSISMCKVGHSEPGNAEMEAEPPVPGLSPVRLQSSQELQMSAQVTVPSHGPDYSCQPSQPDMARGGAPTRMAGQPGVPAEPVGKPAYAGPYGNANEGYSDFDLRTSFHHPVVINKADSQAGEIQERQGSEEMGGSIQSWETPEDLSFHQHVSAMVRDRVDTEYKIYMRDTEKFCNKLTQVVVRKEITKYQDNKCQGTVKPIRRSNLQDKVISYVDMQAKIYIEKMEAAERRH